MFVLPYGHTPKNDADLSDNSGGGLHPYSTRSPTQDDHGSISDHKKVCWVSLGILLPMSTSTTPGHARAVSNSLDSCTDKVEGLEHLFLFLFDENILQMIVANDSNWYAFEDWVVTEVEAADAS